MRVVHLTQEWPHSRQLRTDELDVSWFLEVHADDVDRPGELNLTHFFKTLRYPSD